MGKAAEGDDVNETLAGVAGAALSLHIAGIGREGIREDEENDGSFR